MYPLLQNFVYITLTFTGSIRTPCRRRYHLLLYLCKSADMMQYLRYGNLMDPVYGRVMYTITFFTKEEGGGLELFHLFIKK